MEGFTLVHLVGKAPSQRPHQAKTPVEFSSSHRAQESEPPRKSWWAFFRPKSLPASDQSVQQETSSSRKSSTGD